MKNNKKGFTLVELVIVVALLSILATVAIPTIGHLVETSKETVCISNRTQMERLYMAEMLINPTKNIRDYLKETYGENYDQCPSGGDYYAFAHTEIGSEFVHVYCSEHDGKSKSMYVKASILQDILSKMTRDEQLEFLGSKNNSNDEKCRYLFLEMGQNWDQLEDNVLQKTEFLKNSDKDLYVRPFITNTSHVPLLFVNEHNVEKGQWITNLVFNPRDGKWYEYNPNNSTGQKNFSITSFNGMATEAIYDSFKNTDLWKAVA